MAEEKNGNMKGNVCDCGCGCGWPSGHRLFRVVLGLIVLFVAFWFGVKVGELHSRFSWYGGMYYRPYPVMMNGMNGGGMPMMQQGAPQQNVSPQ